MKAAVVTEFGRPPRYADFPSPTPADGQLTGRVAAASLKNLDRGLVAGTHYGSAALTPPFVAGIDGVVELPDGRFVYSPAVSPHGMMAEQTVVDPAHAVTLPDGINPALAAATPNPGLSAWFSLEYAAQLQPGQSVLILGATGVTGSVAAQLATSTFGAGRVIVAGRNRDRLQKLRDAGADGSVQIGDDFAGRIAALHDEQPFDAVLDYLWGDPAEQVLTTLGNTGLGSSYHRTRFVQIGSMAGSTIALPAAVLRSAGVELVGVGLGSVPAEAQARATSELLPKLFALAASGALTVDVATRPLSEVEAAWSEPVSAGTRVVLVP